MKRLPSKLPWTAEIDGNDLVVRGIHATCFGGKYDKGDNGLTESGIRNDGSNNLLLCALPIRSTEAATRDSPLAFKGPHLPWRTPVLVWSASACEGSAIACLLADNGPRVSRYPTHALDLNPPAALHFSPGYDPHKIANEWSMDDMCFRIIGGARFIS
jgi:hypothetical protein